MDESAFRSLFRQEGAPAARGKFLSRVFGIFSESIVQAWSEDERAPYKNLGRPTLVTGSKSTGPTLDFLFECRRTGKRFVVEQKCEIEYQSFRYFVLTSPDQLTHHAKPAFEAFLAAAKGIAPGSRDWSAGKQRFTVDGAILIWGSVTQQGRKAVIEETGLHDAIGLDRIIAECAHWRHDAYCRLVSERRQWCDELFDFLDGQ